MVRTLLTRADTLVKEDGDKKTEVEHVKTALKTNEYEPWMFNITKKKNDKKKDRNQQDSNRSRPPLIGLPYIKGISEPLERTFRKYGLAIYHKPMNTLRQQLVHPKDPTPKENKSGVIYQIRCQTCNRLYIGETARSLKTRIEEHKKTTSSAVKEHQTNTGHIIDWDNVKIIGKEEHWMKRKIKEAIAIRKDKPSLNRDQGWDLPPIFNSLLSHDLTTGGHVTS